MELVVVAGVGLASVVTAVLAFRLHGRTGQSLDGLSAGLDRMDSGLSRLEGGLDNLDHALERLEAGVDHLEGRVGQTEGRAADAEARLDRSDDAPSRVHRLRHLRGAGRAHGGRHVRPGHRGLWGGRSSGIRRDRRPPR